MTSTGRVAHRRRDDLDGRVVDTDLGVDVPVQYFQTVVAIELAVAGALRLGLALVLGTTVFGSLWAMADEGPKWAAVAVTIGLAVSLVPILLRVLPPLARDAATNERDRTTP